MQQAIACANPMELVVLLYEGLSESIESARQALRAGDVTGRATAASRALEILAELSSSLDRERGGEVASNLARLYEFVFARLQDGNFTQQDAAFAEAGKVVATLLEAWREIRPAAGREAPTLNPANLPMNPMATLSACG